MRTTLTALAFIMAIVYSHAQEKNTKTPIFSLRTSILAPAEVDANVVLGVGVQLSPRFAVIIDPGYVFGQPYVYTIRSSSEQENGTGFKLRSEFRFYLTDLVYKKKATFYLAPALHYKKVSMERLTEVGINCINGECDFFQLDSYRRVKQEIGGLLTFGAYIPLFDNERLALETYIGLGFKKKQFKNTDIPPGATVEQESSAWFGSVNDDATLPMLPAGLKLSYRLN